MSKNIIDIQNKLKENNSTLEFISLVEGNLIFKCNKCNLEKKRNLLTLKKSNYQCANCRMKLSKTISNEEYCKKMPHGYKLESNYTGRNSSVIISHMCGNIWEEKRAGRFIYENKKCPKCFPLLRRDTSLKSEEIVQSILDEFYNKEYIVLGKYINNRAKIEIKHLNCNNNFFTTSALLTSGSSQCVYCTKSVKSKFIFNYLKNKYTFETEFGIDACKGKRNLLLFDFFIKDYNLLIEYDGDHHFRNNHNNNLNDQIKNKYVLNSNFSLIRLGNKLKLNEIKEILDKYVNSNNNEKIMYFNNGKKINFIEYYGEGSTTIESK